MQANLARKNRRIPVLSILLLLLSAMMSAIASSSSFVVPAIFNLKNMQAQFSLTERIRAVATAIAHNAVTISSIFFLLLVFVLLFKPKGWAVSFTAVLASIFMLAIGIIVAFIYGCKICEEHQVTKDNITDVLLFGLPSSIVFARMYYVIFNFGEYKNNLWDIFKIWEGGIAIYGAVIGACLSTYIYCKVKKINFLSVFDVGAFGLLIGQIFGRWGNFVNAEAYGAPTLLPWGMQIAEISQNITFHPTFLYESLWNIGVLIFLMLRRKKRSFEGEMFLSYIILYGVGRFWIEGLRMDSLYLGSIRVSQLVAVACVIFGCTLYIIVKNKRKRVTE